MENRCDITRFESEKEDNRREVKKANGGLPLSLWDTYSAFANCYGGVIILGVAENKDGSWRTTGLCICLVLLSEETMKAIIVVHVCR